MLLSQAMLVDERIRLPSRRWSDQRRIRRSSRDLDERVDAAPYFLPNIFMDFYIHKANLTQSFASKLAADFTLGVEDRH